MGGTCSVEVTSSQSRSLCGVPVVLKSHLANLGHCGGVPAVLKSHLANLGYCGEYLQY